MRRLTVLWLVILVALPLHSGMAKSGNAKMNNGNGKNHLANASSPYLLSHADNPVDWYQWGEEAFIKARKQDKPIFLSIGYNACHWCHVMEHESFENDSIAEFLNKNFVSIKVDREERPDIDQIYMTAVTAMTGSGGWPMTIFMTPDRKPFFAGTYFPPQAKYGRPGFMEVITELSRIYQNDRDKINSSAANVLSRISSSWQEKIPFREISEDVLLSAADIYYSGFDQQHGGFGQAPKFPQGTNISLLMRAFHLSGNAKYGDAAFTTLQKMAQGGIFDHLGGGFHRYSTDREWLTPHFEKMLYDNALLVIPYLEAYQLTGEKQYIDVVNAVLEYLQFQMTDIEGGFYSTQDADSEGEEGKFYTWEKNEIDAVLKPGEEWFLKYYNITERGNFEGNRNILHTGRHSRAARAESGLSSVEFAARLKQIQKQLFEIRQKRIAPATDDKILASWNGLAITAFSNAYLVTGEQSYLESARRGADYVLDKMSRGDTLYHSYRAGRLLKVELLEDYAYFTAGLIDLYQATFSEKYIEKAIAFSKRAITLFSSDDIFYMSPAGEEDLIVRPRDLTDGATPSPASIMIIDLLKLAALSGDSFLKEKGEVSLKAVSGLASRSPRAVASLLLAGDFNYSERVEVVIVGPDSQKRKDFNRLLFAKYMPNRIIVGSDIGGQSDLPLLKGRLEVKELTYYFCKNNSCRLPVSDKNSFKNELDYILTGTVPKSN